MKLVSVLVVAFSAGVGTVAWLWSQGALFAVLCAPFAASLATVAFALAVSLGRPARRSVGSVAQVYGRRPAPLPRR